jgi:hypothetical protein
MSSRLKTALYFGVLPFAASAIVGLFVAVSGPAVGGTITRGFPDTANRILAPRVLVPVLFILSFFYFIREEPTFHWEKTWRPFPVAWKAYIVIICILIGFSTGSAIVSIYLAHRLGPR